MDVKGIYTQQGEMRRKMFDYKYLSNMVN
ncbi:DUF1064 domain-containing protein [Clostridium botulinum]|nr:DUF1064 domain-containing protein [Clostridium botulinum]